MKKSKRNKKPPRKKRGWIFLLVLVASFIISAGGSYVYLKDRFAFDSAFIADIEERKQKAADRTRTADSRRLYGFAQEEEDSEDSVVLRKDTLLVVAEDVIRKFVQPYKVALLDLYMDREGIIYIDFGDEIQKNFKGDAGEELEILAGLYNTMKSTIPGFTALKILIEGRETDSIGGHIDISKLIGEEIAKNIR